MLHVAAPVPQHTRQFLNWISRDGSQVYVQAESGRVIWGITYTSSIILNC